MKKSYLLTCVMMLAMLLTSCNGNEPDPWEHHSETGMYVGITGFSDNVKFHDGEWSRYNVLTKSNYANYTSFINSLSMGDATVLYYAVDNNLTYLANCKFPDDLSSVNIITFTDGLDQGSRALDKQDGKNDYASNDNSYVSAIHEKLQKTTVGGVPITAYAIGIRGTDVQGEAAKTFSDNLVKLSSAKENAMEVSNMDEVNAKFKEIAESLYQKSESRDLTITIPMPSENEKERFTFDNITDATSSKCYLEGIYADGALTNITYVGCMSNSGSKVTEESAGGVKIQFHFENFTDENGNAISTTHMQQWHMGAEQTTWTRNSEFKPSESIVINEERKTAVIMLILDCSSSLGSDFSKVKSAANNFIKTLAGEVNNTPTTDPEPDPDSVKNYYIKHSWGSGADDDWAWKQMTEQSSGIYVYEGLWGGIGANINTTASDKGAIWYSEDEIAGSSALSIGDGVKFTYRSSSGTLTATKTSDGSSSNTAQVRFCKEEADELIIALGIVNEAQDEVLAYHEFGSSAGTSPYYEIPAGIGRPYAYWLEDGDDEEGWYGWYDPETYNFQAGKKYTYSVGDNGVTITLDGSANAPAKVVATKRIAKSQITSLKRIRK